MTIPTRVSFAKITDAHDQMHAAVRAIAAAGDRAHTESLALAPDTIPADVTHDPTPEGD